MKPYMRFCPFLGKYLLERIMFPTDALGKNKAEVLCPTHVLGSLVVFEIKSKRSYFYSSEVVKSSINKSLQAVESNVSLLLDNNCKKFVPT
jgi:hypothetical protein